MSPKPKTHGTSGRPAWRQQELTFPVQPDATIVKDGSDLSPGVERSAGGGRHDSPSEVPECPEDKT